MGKVLKLEQGGHIAKPVSFRNPVGKYRSSGGAEVKIRKILLVLPFLLLGFSITIYSKTPFGDFVTVQWRLDVDSDGKVILLPRVKILAETAKSTTLRIQLHNNYKAWYEVLVKPQGPIISTSSLPTNFVLPPGGRKDFISVTFGPGESLALVADGTSALAQTFLVVDLLWRLFVGSPFPQNLCDLLLQSMDVLLPIAGFLADLYFDIQNRNIPEILLDLGKIPSIPQVAQILKAIALMGGNKAAASKIEKIAGNLSIWLKIMLRAEKIVELELLTLLAPHADVLIFEATLIKRLPQAPQSLKAAVSSSSVELNWQDKSDNEDGFKIYRDGAFIAQVGKGQTNYTDTGLKPSTRYCYQVSAFNSVGESKLSNMACARTLAKPNNPPIANAGPDQTVQVGSTVQLDGSASSDPDGDQIKRYQWTILPRENSAQCIFKSSHSIVNPKIVPLREGSCTIQLIVNDGKLNSAPDQVVITAKRDITPPALITDFQASDDEDSQSTLTWTNPLDEDLAQVIVKRKTTGYPVNHEDGDTRLTIDSATPGRAETFVDTGLTNGITYYYAVFNRDKAGNWNDRVVEGKNADIGKPIKPLPTEAPWPMSGHDAQHTGQSPLIGPKTNHLHWYYQASARYEPVIGVDGTVYITAGGKLHAINPDGTIKWIYDPSPDTIIESPAVGPDGTIYAPGGDIPFNNGFLFAINTDGTLKWKMKYTQLYWTGLLTIGNDGTIYTTAGACNSMREYYAINPDGTLKWTFSNGTGCTGTAAPAIGPDGTVYAPTGGLAALDPENGQVKWKLSISSFAPPAIAPDGTIYISSNGDLYAINPNGTIKWIVPRAGYVNDWSQSPAIGADGTIYTSGYAINPDGTVKWSGGPSYESHIAISSDGVFYYSGFGGWGAANTTNGQVIWSFIPPQAGYADAFADPAIGPDGTLYFSAASGLYAFKDIIGSTPSKSYRTPTVIINDVFLNPLAVYTSKFFVPGQQVKEIKLSIFSLSGRLVFNTDWVENGFTWNLLNDRGQRLANGVYLYVIYVRRFDGSVIRSEVKKLIILR